MMNMNIHEYQAKQHKYTRKIILCAYKESGKPILYKTTDEAMGCAPQTLRF